METVILKNGAEEAEPLVKVMMISLQQLITTEPITFYELVMKARDPHHRLFGNTGEKLQKLNLISADGSMHDSIRNVVLSAATGEGLNMSLNSPYKEEAA